MKNPRIEIILFTLGLTFFCSIGRGQVYEKVFDFRQARESSLRNRGAEPSGSLVQGRDGLLYGTTSIGGATGGGTIYKMTLNGNLTTLFDFSASATNAGNTPDAGLTLGADGNFYGTTSYGNGPTSYGTVFRMTPGGRLTTLVQFTNNGTTNKGSHPRRELIQASDGNFYGTTSKGGANDEGTIFRMTPAGVLTTLVEFTGTTGPNKGSEPNELVQASDGHLYGTTYRGGSSNYGTVFRLPLAGPLTTLVEFVSAEAPALGMLPLAGLVEGQDGSLYGTTSHSATGSGTVFKISTTGELTTLHEFPISVDRLKGTPRNRLIQASNGNFYGTTHHDGEDGWGSVFHITPSGSLTTIASFSHPSKLEWPDGATPSGALLQAADGRLYGVARGGGGVFTLSLSGGLTTLVRFDYYGTSEVGSVPWGSLLRISDGSFLGTTYQGGVSGLGTIYQLFPDGRHKTLVQFSGVDGPFKGSMPQETSLIAGPDDKYYGTTDSGGTNDFGTIFRLTPSGQFSTLVEFTHDGMTNKGSHPNATMLLASDGNFYGTTPSGGGQYGGTVFRVTPAGVLTTLVECPDGGAVNNPLHQGSMPRGSLIQGSDGHIYGTTMRGGTSDDGTIFRMTLSGVVTKLLDFSRTGPANFGSEPRAGIIEGSDGNFYGTTSRPGYGTVFRMTPAGVFTSLAQFNAQTGTVISGLSQGPDGDFYGTTSTSVFRMTPAGEIIILRSATAGESLSEAGVSLAADGNIYGTTREVDGSVFRLIMPGRPTAVTDGLPLVDGTTANIRGQFNARGTSTLVTLEYGTDGITFPNVVTLLVGLNGYQTRLAGVTLESLETATAYHYRFRATNSSGTTVSPVGIFSTLAAPLSTTALATELAPTSARLNGTVNARNYDATARFEWGTDGNNFLNSVASTPNNVSGSAAVAVFAPVAGLTKGTTYYYRVVATNAGGTTVSGTQSFRTLTEPTAGIGGNFALTTTSVRVEGNVNAQGSDSSVVFEYGTDGVIFPNSVAATPGTVTGDASTPVSAVLTTLSQGVTYHYRIRATSAGGVGTSSSVSFSMNVLSGFAQVFPNAPPESEGFLTVNLTPTGILHGWRFIGEQQWRPSGVPVAGLTTSNREIEFRPVPGYVQPEPEPVGIVSGEASVYAFEYTSGGSTGSGGILVTLKPSTLSSAQWRLLGETDADWRNSDVVLTGKAPGNYLIECKPVAGRATPPNVNVSVINGQTSATTITYFIPDATVGTPPAVLSFESVSTDTTRPYAHVGQFRSQVGSSSGFVVKPRVVATAAHVVWDDGRVVDNGSGGSTLAAVQGLQWLFQRYRGVHEPTPFIPRGFYTFDGYAAQRITDNSPGDSSPASQHLDVAAVYFSTNAGRGGYSGFLASDLAQNEFLLSNANKMLVGYPIDGISTTSQGRMHATAPFNVVFSSSFGRIFTTTGIRSSGGNSGGPLCVQFEGGAYYPAAIYLGGDNQTVVRAIDSEVVDLFNRAEISSNGGDNNTGGGITHTSISGTTSSTTGSVQVIIEPEAARNAGAGWRLGTSGSYRLSGAVRSSVTPGSYTLNMITVTGFETPNAPTITVSGGQLVTQTFTYAPLMTPVQTWRQTHFGTTSNTGNAVDTFDFDGDGFTNAQEYASGTNPTLSGDFFKVTDSQRTASTFTASTAGKAGRTYTLQRSTNLTAWTPVGSPMGPLASDGAVTLQDAAMPNDTAFYRIVVTGP